MMFFTANLNILPHLLIGQLWSEKVQDRLDQEYLNLEATLLRAKVIREMKKPKGIYLIQSHIPVESSDLAYLFVPFVWSNLNRPIIYSTPATSSVLSILNKYYQADKKPKVMIDHVLDALNMYIDLSDPKQSVEDAFYLNLVKALCRADISTIFLIVACDIDPVKLKTLAEYLKVEIHLISKQVPQKIVQSDQINMHKLLFKNKDEQHAQLCALFSQKNAALLMHTDRLNISQSTNLIEDMFYSEHIYEKLSVYSEYMQTQIQNKPMRSAS